MLEWSVAKVDALPSVDGMQNVIYAVNCKIKYKGIEWGVWAFLPLPKAESFIPFEQLTKEQVLQWALDSLGPEEIAKQEAIVLELAEEQAPVVVPEEPTTVTLTLP